MDLRTLELRTSEAIRKDGAEEMGRRAAKLSRLEADTTPATGAETELAHALRTRRRLKRPLSSAV
ncbi:hypothetical protein [Hyphomonas chukchiensis]|uniref:Uncharacterized protein n=1 Tax=Hyphomonas chukchiensis TaxID=1280947 RepID=A0A062UHV9_9PROT|nr:hypothetical protein [Hyphomonas chukchiensis]KCZ58372.1 hypothetical protein HY30_16435 [Hyphomonas chukchiensis]